MTFSVMVRYNFSPRSKLLPPSPEAMADRHHELLDGRVRRSFMRSLEPRAGKGKLIAEKIIRLRGGRCTSVIPQQRQRDDLQGEQVQKKDLKDD